MHRGFVASFVLAATALACSSSPAPRPSGWHVADGQLRDPEGRTVVLRGFNVAGSHKHAPYLGFQQAGDYARIRDDWGMSSVRFLLTWAAVEPSRGAYDEAYLDRVEERLAWAEAAGLLVVLDMHQDLYGEGFQGGDGAPRWTCDEQHYAAFQPTNPWFLGYLNAHVQACVDALYVEGDVQARFIAAWRHVAARLSRHANVIGFDALNEPPWGSHSPNGFDGDLLGPFYEKLVPAVREVAPKWVAFLEPGASRNLGIPTTLTRFSFGNVVYAPHSYDSDAEAGKGFDAAHRDHLVANVAALADEAKGIDAALWIGEYGGVAANAGIYEYMDAQYDAAGAVAAGTAYWVYDEDDGYGFLAPDGSEKPDLARAVVRPYPERVAGSLASYAYDDATRTLTFTMTADESVTAPTIVSLPRRLFPSGAEIDCGGCTVAEGPGSASLTRLPAGTRTVTVRPR